MRNIRFFWCCIFLIFFSKLYLAGYHVLHTSEANFYTGASGFYSILTTATNFLLLLIGIVFLCIEVVKQKSARGKILIIFLIGLAIVFGVYIFGNWILTYSFRLNTGKF